MKQDSFITTVENLSRWFELNNAGAESRPYFTLYRGYEAKPDRIIYRNSEISEPEKAWELLEEVLTAHADGGGSFRVFITNKPGFNVGMTTIVKLPNPNPLAAVAGIGNIGANMWGLHNDPKAMIEEEVNRRIEMYELKREIEDMKADKDSRIGAVDRFIENLVERPEVYQIVQHLGMKIVGGAMAPRAPMPPNAIQGTPATDHYTEEEGYDYDRIEPALDKMRRVFPDVETQLERLAAWAAANPELANQLLVNLPS